MNILYPPIKVEKKINQFKVEISHLVLFESVTVNVLLYDQDDNYVSLRIFRIEGDDYKSWSDDDKYIINYIREKLNEECQN